MRGRGDIPSSEDRCFKMNKLTDVLKGKKSESEEFAFARLLSVTQLAEDTSSPYFHLFCRGSSFPHWSAAGKKDGCHGGVELNNGNAEQACRLLVGMHDGAKRWQGWSSS